MRDAWITTELHIETIQASCYRSLEKFIFCLYCWQRWHSLSGGRQAHRWTKADSLSAWRPYRGPRRLY